ncbi:DUF6300 family protein [Sphaerisporangium sp. B11E5]|uniref:DUF6300 family protein n=1 Tax=Sphaerisporangium sp. B11E5 TaxID=3153563 RepID=UPI00325FAEEC
MTDDAPSGTHEIEVVLSNHPPECGRCGREGILSAQVPHNLINIRGELAKGTSIVVLCSHCDIDQAEAGALIAWFTVNSEITGENLMEVAELVHAWTSVAKVPALDTTALDAEFLAWRKGEL